MTRESKRSIEQRIEGVEDSAGVGQISAEEGYAILVAAATGDESAVEQLSRLPADLRERIGPR